MDIEALSKLDDAELGKKLGLNSKLDEAKKAIADMMALEGEAREYAEERVKKMFEPNVYPEDFKWIVEDAERKARCGDDEMKDCCCRSVL